jgi:hypothetical protein
MTIYNYSGATTTYSLFPVTPSTLAVGSTAILQFSNVANGGSASGTASSDVAQFSGMTVTTGTSNAGTASGGDGFYVAFSCN